MGIFNAILNRRIGNKQQKEAAELISAMVSGQGEDIFPQQMGPTEKIIINLVFKQVSEGSGAKYKANLVEMGLGTQKGELEKSKLLFISSVRVNKGYEVEEENPVVNLQIPYHQVFRHILYLVLSHQFTQSLPAVLLMQADKGVLFVDHPDVVEPVNA